MLEMMHHSLNTWITHASGLGKEASQGIQVALSL